MNGALLKDLETVFSSVRLASHRTDLTLLVPDKCGDSINAGGHWAITNPLSRYENATARRTY